MPGPPTGGVTTQFDRNDVKNNNKNKGSDFMRGICQIRLCGPKLKAPDQIGPDYHDSIFGVLELWSDAFPMPQQSMTPTAGVTIGKDARHSVPHTSEVPAPVRRFRVTRCTPLRSVVTLKFTSIPSR